MNGYCGSCPPSNNGAGSTGGAVTIVTNREPRPTFMVQFRRGLLYPGGSTVYDQYEFWYTPKAEDRTPGCGPTSWRRLDMKTIWLKLQRLSDCQADFIFPPIKAAQSAEACDEAGYAQIWNIDSVGTLNGKLYTPNRDGVIGGTVLNEEDWCGGYTAAEVIAYVLRQMCAADAGNLG